MKTKSIHIKSKGMRIVKHWYLPLIAGLLCIGGGLFIFFYPLESYVILSICLGIIMLITGSTEAIMAMSSRNWFFTRPWNIAGAVINILLGIWLCATPGLSFLVLPLIIGAWLLTRSLMLLGLSRDFSNMELRGGGWMFAFGLLLLIISILVILRPFAMGVPMITALCGIGFIAGGISLILIAFHARNIHLLVKKYMPKPFEAEDI